MARQGRARQSRAQQGKRPLPKKAAIFVSNRTTIADGSRRASPAPTTSLAPTNPAPTGPRMPTQAAPRAPLAHVRSPRDNTLSRSFCLRKSPSNQHWDNSPPPPPPAVTRCPAAPRSSHSSTPPTRAWPHPCSRSSTTTSGASRATAGRAPNRTPLFGHLGWIPRPYRHLCPARSGYGTASMP